jgi:serine/threonine-protein kinase
MIIPSPPNRALAAALGSATAVPVVTAIAIATQGSPTPIPPVAFVMRVVLPYLLVVVLAYVGAQIVYHLGRELSRARELGSYRLIERLGHGGMGEVWRAEHRLLARPAAVKLIQPGAGRMPGDEGSAELRTRFTREAEATAALRSPHTIELYDFGVADDGTFYYVMELLEGFDLQELVERFGTMPVSRAVHLLKQV